MSRILEKVIRFNVYSIILPLIKNCTTILTTRLNKLRNRTLTLTKQVSGSASLASVDPLTNIVQINTTIANDNHTHSEGEINASVKPIPSTIVRRNAKGEILSSGTSITNTGYKLANGADISTLFKLPTNNPWSVNTVKTGTTSGVVSAVSVTTGSGANVTLNITLRNTYCYGNVYVC